ncbi:MAG: tetratricopeptide repeat protein [Phycisphaerales bacterium]
MKHLQSTCPWMAELDWVDGAPLADERLAELAAHVEECEQCRAWLESGGNMASLAIDLRAATRARSGAMVDVAGPVERLNELLKGYEIQGELGRGGMGVVYKAWQSDLRRHVALKVLPALIGAVRPEAVTRFRREAALAASLKHTNIIGVYDFGEAEGTLYYVMELIEGRSLRDLLQEMRAAGGIATALGVVASATDEVVASQSEIKEPSRYSRRTGSGADGGEYFRRVAVWIADVAEALHYAHEKGVIHRDIKPANLMLSRTGRLMICDFGLARSVMTGRDASTVTMPRTIVGTSRYMSPESVDPSLGPADRRSDVYALGATLYELLTFRPMFEAHEEREILQRVLTNEPARPRTIVRQIPRELEVICTKALSKRAKDRYDTAQAFADDLRRWLLGTPILARRPNVVARVVNYVRRRKLVSGLAAALVLAGVAGAALGVHAWSESHRANTAALQVKSQRVGIFKQEATVASAEGHFTEALSLLDRALVDAPMDVPIRRERAWVIHKLERTGEAVDLLEAICAEAPEDWRAHYHLASIYRVWTGAPVGKLDEHSEQVRKLMPDTAEAFYVRSLVEKDDRAAIELLDKAFELSPGMLEVLIQRAARNAAQRNYEAALRDMDRAATLAPKTASIHANRGVALEQLRRFGESELAFAKAIDLNPMVPYYWTGRAKARLAVGQFDGALSDATQAIELNAMVPEAFLVRAKANASRGAFETAIADCDQAILLDVQCVDGYVRRSAIHHQLGQWEAMLADCTSAIEVAPDDPAGYQNRIAAWARLGKLERAIPDVDRYVELKPNDPLAHSKRAALMARLHRFDEAEASTTRLIELEGLSGDHFHDRGWLRIALGRGGGAAADFTRSIELAPRIRDQHLGRAAAYRLMGQWDLSLQDLDAARDAEGQTGVQARLWRYLMLLEAGRAEDARAALLEAGGTGTDPWMQKVAGFLSGTVTRDSLLADAAGLRERVQAHYYIGMKALLAGDRETARSEFEECAKIDQGNEPEALLASGRLQKLAGTGAGR